MTSNRVDIVRIRYKKILTSGEKTWTSISLDQSIICLSKTLHGASWQKYLVQLAKKADSADDKRKSTSRIVAAQIAGEAAARLKEEAATRPKKDKKLVRFD